MLSRLGFGLAVSLGALASYAGCYAESAEGDRCNPLRSSDECNSGLHCSGNPIGISIAYPIPYCPENYCCPDPITASDNPYCQPGCNGGAAAICAASSTDTEACEYAACLADASDPSTCPVSSEASTSSDAEATDAAATTSEAAADVVSSPEASPEAPTSPEATAADGSTQD